MENKFKNIEKTQNNEDIKPKIQETNNQANCQYHTNQNNNINNNHSKNIQGLHRDKILSKVFFIPFLMLKIASTYILYIKYYCYNLQNEEDIKYSRFTMTIFIIFVYILLLLNIFTPSEQTNVDKYTVLNKEISDKREIIELNQGYKICEFCNHIKFDRTSHCRVCKKCISFRDHHCLFTDNCIGFNNIQYFVNFLFWSIYGNIYYMYCYLTFSYLNISKTIKIINLIDFIGNCCFFYNKISVIIRSLVAIYANRTFVEMKKDYNVEIKCPFIDCFKNVNKKMKQNPYNIGFLTHFYYAIGPSLLHFFFPLNKFKKYTLDENCPIFCKAKYPDSIQLLKYYLKNDENFYEEVMLKTSEPDDYLKLCHEGYDGYIIK